MAVLINGNGNEAIYAQQDADWYAALMGGVTMITAVGQQFAYELLDANTIGVKDGVIITKEGRRIQVDTNVIDTFDIPTGAQGTTNYYIIGYHLVTDDTSSQTAETFVQLMENGTDTIPEGSFKEGDDDVYVSLYRVEQNDLNIGTITLLLPTVSDSMQQQINTINNDLSSKADKSALSDYVVEGTTFNGNITPYVTLAKEGIYYHITGLIEVINNIPQNTDLLYLSVINKHAITIPLISLTSGVNNCALYSGNNSNHFINSDAVLSAGRYLIDSWFSV